MEHEDNLQIAIRVARSGERDRARDLFAEIVRREPANAHAWLWLSELTDRLEEQTTMLEIAQEILSGKTGGECDVQAYLNDMRGGIALPAPSIPAPADSMPAQPAGPSVRNLVLDDQLFQANRLIILGKREEAARLLAELGEAYPQDERIPQLQMDLQSSPSSLSTEEPPSNTPSFWGKLANGKLFTSRFSRG